MAIWGLGQKNWSLHDQVTGSRDEIDTVSITRRARGKVQMLCRQQKHLLKRTPPLSQSLGNPLHLQGRVEALEFLSKDQACEFLLQEASGTHPHQRTPSWVAAAGYWILFLVLTLTYGRLPFQSLGFSETSLNESNNPRLTGLLCKMEETGQGEGPSVRAFRPSFEFPSTTKHWRGWCLTVMFSDITESPAWAHWVTVHWPPPAAGELQLDSACPGVPCPTPQGFLQDTWEEKDTVLLPAASATPCRFRVGNGGCILLFGCLF